MSERTWYGFFPYLSTRERVVVRGVELRGTHDLDGLSPGAQHDLRTLAAMFCRHDGTELTDMVYTTMPAPASRDEESELSKRLSRVQSVLTFLYTMPPRNGRAHPHLGSCHLLPLSTGARADFTGLARHRTR
jgi:hypothetical protein